MAQVHLFKCSKCNAELVGPMYKGGDVVPKVGNTYSWGSPVGCGGICGILKSKTIYQGLADRIPNAPPVLHGVPAPQPKIPMKWTQASADAPYVASALFDEIPPVFQAALIVELDTYFATSEIALLSATSDRFDVDAYADPLDARIVVGVDPAEKKLTTTMVLTRLNDVLSHRGAVTLTWGPVVIDRPQFCTGCSLTLPLRIATGGATYRFHRELLNDLVNPRHGHAVRADVYFPVICKAIALARANTPGQNVQGSTHGYYFWSDDDNRGINVVLMRGSFEVLTVYYCSAVAAWWNHGGLSAAAKLDRTI